LRKHHDAEHDHHYDNDRDNGEHDNNIIITIGNGSMSTTTSGGD
jgi:hypothetical protein